MNIQGKNGIPDLSNLSKISNENEILSKGWFESPLWTPSEFAAEYTVFTFKHSERQCGPWSDAAKTKYFNSPISILQKTLPLYIVYILSRL